jgi:large subunit ribosomal protein L23
MRLNNVVTKPIITEKAVSVSGGGKYVFRVAKKASKQAIASEIGRMYGVEVIGVNTCVMPGKKRRVLKTRLFTKTPRWKKATVQLKEGQSIELFPKEK